MDFEPIISSGLVGGLALIGVIYQARKSRTVNTREHEENSTKLSEISTNVADIRDKVDTVNDRLTDHIANHHRKWWQR